MNTWNDIYDFSEKVLSYILRRKEEEYIQPDQNSPVEKMADKLGHSETLAGSDSTQMKVLNDYGNNTVMTLSGLIGN